MKVIVLDHQSNQLAPTHPARARKLVKSGRADIVSKSPFTIQLRFNPASYDNIIVAFSGGKDSTACYLYLLDCGVKPEQIEIWHHRVDGNEGSTLMDWPVTDDYCRKFAEAFGSPIYYNWKVGGFEREMLRENALTAPTKFETPSGEIKQVGGISGKPNTRRKFPQITAALSSRWCSAYLKIDVASASLRNQERFNGKRTLFLTGERGEESPGRAKYAVFEPDRADNRTGKKARHVDHWRPIKDWTEKQVWEIIERYGVNPHLAYKLGWGRVSCAGCIFGNANQFASLNKVNPAQLKRLADYEDEFGRTIKRDRSIGDLLQVGKPYSSINPTTAAVAMSKTYTEQIFIDDWNLPAGAFGDSCGPT